MGHLALPASALLEFLANPSTETSAAFGSLNEAEWVDCVRLAFSCRAGQLLAHYLRDQDKIEVPNDIRAKLDAAERAQSVTALMQSRVLVETVVKLQRAGLRAVALKGVPLSLSAYPAPHLRPLRDIDLLLTPHDAATAHELLVQSSEYQPALWAGRYGVEHSHQLPEIVHCETGTVIELHHRLNSRNWKGDQRLAEQILRQPARQMLLGQEIETVGPEDNVLHLVEHAALHHAFANGALVLSDLHFLFQAHALDWSALANDAERFGLRKPFALVTAFAARHGAHWAPSEPPQMPHPLLDACDTLLLLDDAAHRTLAQKNRLIQRSQGKAGIWSAMLRAPQPDPHELARIAGCHVDDTRKWLAYPSWALEKGARYLASRIYPQVDVELAHHRTLSEWLADKASD